MLHRLQIDLAFPSEEQMTDLLEEAVRRLPHAVTINPGTPHQEHGYIRYHPCSHDTDPLQNCTPTQHWETP